MSVRFLKLNATTDEDLKVISAHLQDSITQPANIVHLKKNRICLIQFNRFMWEDVEKGVFRQNKRIRCALKFEEVLKVKSQNINQKRKDKPLEYLAIKCGPNLDKTFEIKIFFAGGSIITIIVEFIEVFLNDLGLPWDVKHIPKHKI